MVRGVRLRLPTRITRDHLVLAGMLSASAVALGMGLPRLPIVPAFGVTWNLVPGMGLLLLAGLLYGREWSREEPPEPVVGFMALMLGLPFLAAVVAYAPLGPRAVVGGDLALLGRLASGEESPLGILPRLCLWLVGPSATAFFYASLAVHAMNASLVGLLGLRLARNRGIGLLSGVMFACFPLHVEAVAWLRGERLLEGSFLVLASLVLASFASPRRRIAASATRRDARAERRQERKRAFLGNVAYLLSLVCLAFALPATPLALATPLVVVLLDLRDQHALGAKVGLAGTLVPALGRSVGHFAVLLAALSLGWADDGRMAAEGTASLLTLLANLLTFPRDLLIPLSSTYYRTQTLLILVGVVLLAELLLLALLRRRPDAPTCVFALLVTVAFALPALPYLTPDESPSGSRFLYLSAAAFVVLGSVFLRVALGTDRRSGGWLLAGLALAVSIGCLRSNMRLWRQTGRLGYSVVQALAGEGARLPPGSVFVLTGWPREVDGVPFPSPDDLDVVIRVRRRLTGGPDVRITAVPEAPVPGAAMKRFHWEEEERWMRAVPPSYP